MEKVGSQHDGGNLSDHAAKVLAVLKKYSPLAETIFRNQCEKGDLDASRIGPGDMHGLVPLLVTAVSRFTSPVTGQQLRNDLMALDADPPPGRELRLPVGLVLGAFSLRVLDVLNTFTPFAWPILQTHCQRVNLDATRLTPGDLDTLISGLVTGLSRWTSPEKGEVARARLLGLKNAD